MSFPLSLFVCHSYVGRSLVFCISNYEGVVKAGVAAFLRKQEYGRINSLLDSRLGNCSCVALPPASTQSCAGMTA